MKNGVNGIQNNIPRIRISQAIELFTQIQAEVGNSSIVELREFEDDSCCLSDMLEAAWLMRKIKNPYSNNSQSSLLFTAHIRYFALRDNSLFNQDGTPNRGNVELNMKYPSINAAAMAFWRGFDGESARVIFGLDDITFDAIYTAGKEISKFSHAKTA